MKYQNKTSFSRCIIYSKKHMLLGIKIWGSEVFFVILRLSPVICGTSEEGQCRVLGGSYFYERRYCALFLGSLKPEKFQTATKDEAIVNALGYVYVFADSV